MQNFQHIYNDLFVSPVKVWGGDSLGPVQVLEN